MSLFLAGIVAFKVIFGGLYIIKWKYRYCCVKKYAAREFDLKKYFKDIQMRHSQFGHDSESDDELDNDQLHAKMVKSGKVTKTLDEIK